jgi:hypothetical protein
VPPNFSERNDAAFLIFKVLRGRKRSRGDVWFVIKYLLMLFRQNIPIPNYKSVGLGQCSGEVSSGNFGKKRVSRGAEMRREEKGFL